ncbi:hypothetical protein [Desulfurivibrio sp. C05AmB]|jgi:hypothetical protein|uniref:transglycosylase SLT domain-containing protein n=1 Tax=Desulfurivibrio sp. C05AmB TaxID=3374371 RepID=UPI00376F232A
MVTNSRVLLLLLVMLAALLLAGCATRSPARTSDLCSIFEENRRWHKQAQRAEKRWDSPIPVMMAIMHQESRFQARAKPPRNRIFGVIPASRPSSSYGYSQALRGTWDEYRRESGNTLARRNRFGDAIDFIGWYNHKSQRRSNIRPNDAYSLYLAYHEGHGGFNRRTYQNKPEVRNVARRVATQAERYDRQYNQCRSRLERRWFFF